MQKKIKNYILWALFIFFIELIIALGYFFCYYFGIIITDYLIDIIIFSFSVFILINLIYLWVILVKLGDARKKNDLTALDIVGSGIQEVYNFGQIGLIIIDDQHKIIWANDLFDDVRMDNTNQSIIDCDIYAWKTELQVLSNDTNSDVKVVVDNRTYLVKFIQDANLFIFKDIHNYEITRLEYERNAPVIGIISVDNYSEIISRLDEVKANQVSSKLQSELFDYAKDNGILMRQVKSDGYFFIATKTQFDKMNHDDFAILDKVKEITSDKDIYSDIPLTLSIGIGFGNYDYLKINDLAKEALEIALSRAGDQVVINPLGANLTFKGGRNDAKTGKNRTRLTILSNSLMTWVKNTDNIYIMGHRDMDMDALGSSLGVYAFCSAFGMKSRIIYDEDKVETKTRMAFRSKFTLEERKAISITSEDAIANMTKQTLLIMCDHNNPKQAMSEKLINLSPMIAIIDHHRSAEDIVESPNFKHIDNGASSTSEIVTEFIKFNTSTRIMVESRIATFMLAGILLDTNYYRHKTCARTYDASLTLKEFGADNEMADSFLKEGPEEHIQKVTIMSRAKSPRTGIYICKNVDDEILDQTMLSRVAQETLQIQDVNACFAIGRIGSNDVKVSARSDGTYNVQILMEKMGGGGHLDSAATVIKNQSVDEVDEHLREVIRLYLDDVRINKK
jgi:c-di-AMP phosphodiesterase-like protein